MEVVSLLLPLLSMVWRPWRAPPTIPNAEARLQPYGIILLVTKSSSLRVLSSRLKTSLSKATPEDFEEYVQDFNEF
ncbi:hypothetical protein U9M48_043323 [Paspalum notatum var. saurae]|uniref:Uncharacterized protein n=1 Tax=Paspalum notatum var. saurae TaxID=547442 RepID=A0AAQ3XH79_PASNO